MKKILIASLLGCLGLVAVIRAQQEPIASVFSTVAGYVQSNPNQAPYAICLGLATVGDGQGGMFAYLPASGTSTNSTNVFAFSGGYAGRAIRQFGGGGLGFSGDGTVYSNTLQSVYASGGSLTLPLKVQNANTVFGGPTNGAAAAPHFLTALEARVTLGIPETGTNAILPLVAGGTGTNTAKGIRTVLELPEGATNAAMPLLNTTTAKGGRTALELNEFLTNSAAAFMAAIGLQGGTNQTADDGTVTNTFPIPYAAIPISVITTPRDTTALTNAIVSITTTNCVVNLGANGIGVFWISFGAP